MTRTRMVLAVIVISSFVTIACGVFAGRQRSSDRAAEEKLSRIRKGMTPAEVETIMEIPPTTPDSVDGFHPWNPESCRAEWNDGRNVIVVEFDRTGHVMRWYVSKGQNPLEDGLQRIKGILDYLEAWLDEWQSPPAPPAPIQLLESN